MRVLHVMAGADAGGISAVVLNYYKHIDREKIQFDIAITTDSFGLNGKKLKELGAKFYRLPLKSSDRNGYRNKLKRILMTNGYDAIHVHENSTSFYALRIAKKCGVKIRIAHSHTTNHSTNTLTTIKIIIGQVLNYWYATKLVACGKMSGDHIFGKMFMKTSKAIILPNAIDPADYSYNYNERNKIREKLNVHNCFVVGMIGRLSIEKNYKYAFDIIQRAQLTLDDIVLCVVGNGEQEEELKKLSVNMNLQDRIIFLGRRNDINILLNAFDVLVMPSLYEGFPVTAVEALGTGIPILLSDTITPELKKFKTVTYLSLDIPERWVTALRECKDSRNKRKSLNIYGTELDINTSVKKLQNIYFGEL